MIPKLSSFYLNTYIISQFLWVRSSGIGWAGYSAQRSLTGYNWPGLGSHLKVEVGKDVPLSSWGCWRNSVPRGLLDGGPWFLAGCWPEITLSSLPCGPFHRGSLLYRSVVANDTRDSWCLLSGIWPSPLGKQDLYIGNNWQAVNVADCN